MTNAALRLFIAIDLNDPVRAELQRLKQELDLLIKQMHPRWSPPETLHLTLKFLGATEPGLLEEIASHLEEVARNLMSSEHWVEGLGTFPSTDHARVLWAGLKDPEQRLSQIARTLDLKMSELGFHPETRRFSPHLTLAKFRNPANLRGTIESFGKRAFGRVRVDSLKLYQSTLHSKGSIYELIREFPLTPAR